MASPQQIVRFPAPTARAGAGLEAEDLDDFPESAFPVAADVEAEYRRLCRRGYATMARQRVVITGLARNLESILPVSMRRITSLMGRFADARAVIFENDSTDNTKALLRNWAATDRRVVAVSEDADDPVNPMRRCLARGTRMARYRTRCHELVTRAHSDYDAVIVVDLDVRGGWSEEGIANTFGQQERWDFVGANGVIFRRQGLQINQLRQYDSWALRLDDAFTPIPAASLARIAFPRGAPLHPLTSCFGGLGIYSMAAYAAGDYFHGAEDCEHVRFHRALVAAGYDRLFLNPSLIVLYGRRHRSTDRLVRPLLRAWQALTGSVPEPWHFAERQAAPPAADRRRRAA